MKTIVGINKIKKQRKVVVALGVFDGLHRGHLSVLRAVVKKAKQIKGLSVVLTFWPHPQKQESLYSLNHRLRLFAALGIDTCIVINFNKKFSRTSAEDFIKKILVDKIGAQHIFIGENFRFGRLAKGSHLLLQKFAKIYNYSIKKFSIVRINKKPISSTAIRKLIKAGNLKESEKLLGRPVSVLGSVIKGSKLGRRIGFPTANINPHHEVIPPVGIYAVKVILSNKTYSGLCYIGRKPTINALNRHIGIEVYIYDFYQEIYGQLLEIQFLKLIRPDRKFSSIEDLTAQIKKDVIFCRKFLKHSLRIHNS
ncbi:MAG: riboflavin biosynthesis protein RibF [Candidatus Omnitrophota bacterium]